MKTLFEALIGKKNIDNACQSLRGLPTYNEYKKKDLKTGDLVIIKWPQLLVFIKKEDANWDNFTVGDMFQSPNIYGDNFCLYERTDKGNPTFTFLHLDNYSADLKDWDEEDDFDIIKVIPGVIKKKDVKDPKRLATLLDNYEYLVNELTESLDEALINSRNIDNVSAGGKLLKKFTKKDLETGDIVILKDYTAGMYISEPDFKDSDRYFRDVFYSREGSVVFPKFEKIHDFEWVDVSDYNDNLISPSFVADSLSVLVILKHVADPNLRKDKVKLWDWFIREKNYVNYLPPEIAKNM